MRRPPLPQHLVDQARQYASGEAVPVEARDASTVVLMRDSHEGPEVYLLKRQTSMAFAGGMCVFPGGGVDQRDYEDSLRWAGPTPAEWGERLGTPAQQARALVCAAVRETFEESGVLLAGPSDDALVGDVSGDDWEADRVRLESKELSLVQFLHDRDLVLRSDLLAPFAGWLTPAFEPRRYRTWFFAARVPAGQTTRDVSTESSSVVWMPAMAAVEAVEGSELLMLPPTYLSCLDVAQHADSESMMATAAGRTIDMFTPEVVADGDEFILSTPPFYERLMDTR